MLYLNLFQFVCVYKYSVKFRVIMPVSRLFVILCISAVRLTQVLADYEVIYAVNCGGPKHTDRFGIQYQSDGNPEGIGSEYGRGLMISRVHPEDAILYQTERYHVTYFAYDVHIPRDGVYLLILKFSEVYFEHPGGKVRCLWPCTG